MSTTKPDSFKANHAMHETPVSMEQEGGNECILKFFLEILSALPNVPTSHPHPFRCVLWRYKMKGCGRRIYSV